MISTAIFSIFFFAIGAQCLLAAAPRASSGTNSFPTEVLGDIAAVQWNLNGSLLTRMFYQDDQGNLIIHGVDNGTFNKGKSSIHEVLVPAAGVLLSTPIAASITGSGKTNIHVYFVGPGHKLREFRFSDAAGWRGGADCPNCIDHAGFFTDRSVLYALEHPTSDVLRVGFIDSDAPETVTEAFTSDNGATWQSASLPNA